MNQVDPPGQNTGMSHAHRCADLVPLFRALPEADRDSIERSLVRHAISKGDQIFSPGDEPALSILAHGLIKVYQVSKNGKEQLLRVMRPGDYEGEAWLLGQENIGLYGQALEKGEICLLPHKAFHDLLVAQPLLAVRLLEQNAKKLTDLEHINSYLSLDRVEERLGLYLLDLLADAKAQTGKSRPIFELPMRGKELATLLGTTPESISRKLHDFEDNGYIKRQGRLVQVVDSAALETAYTRNGFGTQGMTRVGGS